MTLQMAYYLFLAFCAGFVACGLLVVTINKEGK